jgi:chloramphenicol 3-O-phosphotransferase
MDEIGTVTLSIQEFDGLRNEIVKLKNALKKKMYLVELNRADYLPGYNIVSKEEAHKLISDTIQDLAKRLVDSRGTVDELKRKITTEMQKK